MTSDYVKNLIDKAYAEKATFLDLGNCDLTEVPEEIVKLAPWLKELNFGSGYYQDGQYISSGNKGLKNKLGDTASLLLLKQLVNLTTLDISDNSIGEKGAEYISSLQWLIVLNVRTNRINEIGSKSISALSNLISLDISYNKVNDGGIRYLSALKSLKSLYINSNRLGEKGAEYISGIKELNSLDIRHNGIGEKGAEYISRLNYLTNLDIGSNLIDEKGAKYISGMINLRKLDISFNRIGNNGAKYVSMLSNLFNLNIGYNSIGNSGAKYVSMLKSLTVLNICYNNIGEEGAEFLSCLENILDLNISNNNIGVKGAEYISRLNSLANLNIGNNKIEVKGAEYISRLYNLTGLDISSNYIGDKGAEYLSHLFSLIKLDISSNSIGDKGAEYISRLYSLSSLDISLNKIGTAGTMYVAGLFSLKKLFIHSNSIGEKGAEYVTQLADLTNLNISSNYIGEKGAEYISFLSNLNTLNIDSNSIGDEGAEYISGLNNLLLLSISNNNIGVKGAEYLSRLSSLTILNLSSNRIGNMGLEYLSALSNLTFLDIDQCHITNSDIIKKLLTELTKLENFIFQHNQIQELPQDIGSDINSLTAYFRSVQKIPNTLVKMVLIGNTTAGKSSLAEYLISKKYDADRESTHGIELWRWQTGDNTGDLQVNIWDFGGQDYFHATHNIFLTDKTLFLLLHTSREIHLYKSKADPSQWLPVNYWLGNIRELSSNDSLIWAVRTKTDLGETEQIDQVKGKQYRVEKEFNISVKKDFAAFGKNNDFQHFKNTLIEKLETMAKDELPLVWVEIRDKWLPVWRETENYYLTREEFKILCVQAFKDEPRLLKDLEYVNEMVGYLGKTGEIVVFEEEPRLNNMIFLSASKLTKQLYKTVLSEQVRDSKGFVDIRQFGAEKLSETELYINVLFAYGLIFRTKDDKYVVPQYLPENEYESALAESYPLRLVIHFPDYMSRSMIARFIVEFAGKDEQSRYWRYGAYFRLDGVPMFVKINVDEQKVYIQSTNTEKDTLQDNILKLFLFFAARKMEEDEKSSGKYFWRHGESYLDKPLVYGSNRDSYLVKAGIELSVDGNHFVTAKEIKTSLQAGINVVRTVSESYIAMNDVFNGILQDRVTYIRRVVFIYAIEDKVYQEELEKQFSSLKRTGRVEIRNIRTSLGGDQQDQITEGIMKESDIAVLLLSSDCMHDNDIWNKQIPAAKRYGVKILPVFLRYCIIPAELLSGMLYGDVPDQDRKWVVSEEGSRDKAYMQVVSECEKLMI